MRTAASSAGRCAPRAGYVRIGGCLVSTRLIRRDRVWRRSPIAQLVRWRVNFGQIPNGAPCRKCLPFVRSIDRSLDSNLLRASQGFVSSHCRDRLMLLYVRRVNPHLVFTSQLLLPAGRSPSQLAPGLHISPFWHIQYVRATTSCLLNCHHRHI